MKSQNIHGGETITSHQKTLKIEEGAIEIHGITNEKVNDSPSIAMIYSQIKKNFRGKNYFNL